uniref:FZ domain-containing protein n=1 Tax=Syphacia muris TaxID=451379 RepID=A0A0N5B1B0_9BILA
MTFLVLLFWLVFPEVNSSPYISDSFVMYSSNRPTPDKCIPIPKNFTLCYGMQYKTMRLPNLLDHDTLDEVIEQAEPWPVLTNLNCHPDAQLFLCSLFAPVCLAALDREILPCRSLCEAVKKGCELRMIQYGFPWPDILSCKKFPQDNDMCIKVVAGKKQRGKSNIYLIFLCWSKKYITKLQTS